MLQVRLRARIVSDRILWAVRGVRLDCESPPGGDSRDSPRDSLRFEPGGRGALLCYGQPSARGRRIFGELVPYGELWRTGADEPTVLVLPFAASVAGLHVPRGRYAIYTVPGEDVWQVIVNRSTRQSGRTREEVGRRGNVFPSGYTAAVRWAELGRATVEARRVPHVEQLTVRAEPAGPTAVNLLIEWEETQVCLPVTV